MKTKQLLQLKLYSVTLGEILTAIKAEHNTLNAVMDETNAGTACTLCQTQVIDVDNERDLHLDEILEYAKTKGFC